MKLSRKIFQLTSKSRSPGREQSLVRRDQPLEATERIVAQRRLVLGHEHQAEALRRRDRHQGMRLLVEAGEARFVRDVAQPSFEIVGPAVIAADEGARAAGAACDLHAAMPAGVPEGPDLAVVATHHDEGNAGRLARNVGADLRQGSGRTERRRRAAQDALELGLQALGAAVVGDRLAPHRVAEIGRAVGDVVEHALRHGLVVHPCFHAVQHTPTRRTGHVQHCGFWASPRRNQTSLHLEADPVRRI